MWRTRPAIVKLDRDFDDVVLERIQNSAEQIIRDAYVYKQCKARWVAKIDSVDAPTCLLKWYTARSRRHAAKQLITKSRAAVHAIHTRHLIDAGLPVPRPLAYLEERVGPLRGRSCLVYEFISGFLFGQTEELYGVFTRNGDHDPVLRVVEQLREVFDLLDRLNLHHYDAHGSNFMFDQTGKLYLLDTESIRWYSRFLRKRNKMIAKQNLDRLVVGSIKNFSDFQSQSETLHTASKRNRAA